MALLNMMLYVCMRLIFLFLYFSGGNINEFKHYKKLSVNDPLLTTKALHWSLKLEEHRWKPVRSIYECILGGLEESRLRAVLFPPPSLKEEAKQAAASQTHKGRCHSARTAEERGRGGGNRGSAGSCRPCPAPRLPCPALGHGKLEQGLVFERLRSCSPLLPASPFASGDCLGLVVM